LEFVIREKKTDPSREGDKATVGATGPAIATTRAKQLEPKGHLFGAVRLESLSRLAKEHLLEQQTPLSEHQSKWKLCLSLKLFNPILRLGGSAAEILIPS
jgi:hypothetical protein